jgi:hypothetical protein
LRLFGYCIFLILLSSCRGGRIIVSGLSSTNNVSELPLSLSFAGSTGIIGYVGVTMSVSPTTLDSNGAAITNCVASPALTVGLSINTSTCVISGTPTGTLSSTSYSITATNSAGTSTAAAVTLSVAVFSCPIGYLEVSANPLIGVMNPFCVAQFEMKNVASTATSQAMTNPWVSISQTDAKTACLNLGTGYDLISNPEWVTIAHEIENNPINWSSGMIGVGMLNRGHSDGTPFSSLGITDTNNPYNGTGNNSGQAVGAGWEQKRTHTISNGQTIWDFSGNVWEWADWGLEDGLNLGPITCNQTPTQIPSISCDELSESDYMPTNPAGVAFTNYNSNYGLGQFIGGIGGSAQRSGSWGSGDLSGIFLLALANDSNYTDVSVGFRCVWRP